MSGWNRQLVSRAVACLMVLLFCDAASAAERLRPAPGVEGSSAWSRYGDADRAWAATWPTRWAQDERLFGAPQDSLTTLLELALSRAASVASGEEDTAERTTAFTSWSSRLRDRWHERGYLMCTVTLNRYNGMAAVTVDPGPQFRVGRVEVSGDSTTRSEAWLARWLPQEGEPCNRRTWERAVDGLLNTAGDEGYPFAGWSVREIRVDPRNATVDIRGGFSPGEALFWGPISSTLGQGAAHLFLERTSGIRAGRPFRESDLRAARRRLLARGIYQRVDEPVVFVTAAPGTVGVHWPVVPRLRPNRMAVMLGLSRPDDEQGTRLSGQVDLLLGNIAGTGRRLDLAWSDDGDDRSHFGFGWREPLVAGMPLDAAVALDQEIVADVHSRLRLDADLSLPLRAAWSVELGMGRDRGTFPTGEWTSSRRWRTRGSLRHRRLDVFNSGWDGLFTVESARRSAELRPTVEGETVSILQEELQTLVSVDFEGETMLKRTLSLALRGKYAGVSGDAELVPLIEQSRLGGARSLRGYREDQFHGEQTASLAFELRLGQPGRSRVYTFLDLGYVLQSRRDPDTDAIITSTDRPRGYGLGIETKSVGGDVSLAIGFPGSLGFDEAKLHVSLQQSF